MLEKFKRKELLNPERHQQRVLQSLQKELSMKKLPRHIECFDNSNFQGNDAVSAMVCFINGKPQKKEYRHFNIKSVVGPNDYASMEEVVYRRYKRLLEEQKELPDLIIIDGGKGQLHVAYQALQKLKIEKEVTLIGIAERLEDIYKIGDPLPLYLDKKSEAQKLIQKIRDEAHRFGLAHHRKKKIKTSLSSILTDIEGISTISAQKLLQHFKSVKRISEAKEDEIAEVIGKSKARKVYTFFKKVE
jgi:excinuclease ABC subunit C